MPRSTPFSLALVLASAIAPQALAHDGEHGHAHPPKPVPEAEAHRPTAIPDRIIRTIAGDPARTIAVTWRTDATVDKGVAQIAPADAAPRFAARAKTFDAVSTTFTSDLGSARYHSIVFEDLAPGRPYAYRVGDGVNWSEWVHAWTASDKPEPFSFIYFGDAQNDLKSLWSRVIRGAYTEAPRAKLIIHAGDLVNRGSRDAEWGEWHGAGGWVNAMVPSVPVPGNHEYEKPKVLTPTAAEVAAGTAAPPAVAAVTKHWRPQFTLPTHGPAGLEETVYTFDYQGVRFLALNSNEKQAEQAAWLAKVLADNPCKWTVAAFHHPIYSAAKERDNPTLRNLWQPVLDRYKVDLVLTGHDHTYARSGLRVFDNVATGVNRRDGEGGTVYVVSVSGPKMYNNQRADWMKRAAEDTQLFQIIHIDGDTLRYEARTALGDLYDAFDLTKRPGGPNRLTERVPATPERLRTPVAKPQPAAAATGAASR